MGNQSYKKKKDKDENAYTVKKNTYLLYSFRVGNH